jgi:hypothetical protein
LLLACATTTRPPGGAAVPAPSSAPAPTSVTAPAPASAPAPVAPVALSPATFEPAIGRMVASNVGGAPVKVLAVAGPVEGWVAVAVSPPYREFPTVVLFRAGRDGAWTRVFEGLMPGVQSKPTGLLDLHTTGHAFDFTIDGPAKSKPLDIVLSTGSKRGLATVAHAYFFHAHPAGADNYFVDRTATYELARRLFPDEYDIYPRTECTMFDVPAIVRIDLASKDQRLVLTADTNNGQRWVITWTGVDDRGLLTGKTVDASNFQ